MLDSPPMDQPDNPLEAPTDESISISIVPARPPRVSQPTSLASVILRDAGIIRLLEDLVAATGMTQDKLAHRIGMKQQTFNQYMTGRVANPSLRQFIRIAEACGARVWVEFPNMK